MDRWYVIINPVAGSRRGLLDWPQISKLLRDNYITYDAVFTEKKHHATELTVEAINKNYRKIVVVGGDGTLHEVVHGLFLQKTVVTTEVTLAVIAVGTGNDWIRMYGIPRKYSDAVKAIVECKTFLQDVAKVEYKESEVEQVRYMVNMAGIGFDAVVNRRYNRLKAKGYYHMGGLYILSLIFVIFSYRSFKFKVRVDGQEVLNKRLFTGAVGIGKYNGGGMLQTPSAIADDGLLDMTFISKMSNISVFRHIRKLYDGNIYNVPRSLFFRGERVEIESIPATPLEVDGEALGFAPIALTTLHRALKVVVV